MELDGNIKCCKLNQNYPRWKADDEHLYCDSCKRKMLIQVTNFATEAHDSAVRKMTEEQLILHSMRIAKHMPTTHLACVAMLHDVVEDTGQTVEDIRQRFGNDIATDVDTLTHKAGVEYMDYIRNIVKVNKKLAILKLHDNLDNVVLYTKSFYKYKESILFLCDYVNKYSEELAIRVLSGVKIKINTSTGIYTRKQPTKSALKVINEALKTFKDNENVLSVAHTDDSIKFGTTYTSVGEAKEEIEYALKTDGFNIDLTYTNGTLVLINKDFNAMSFNKQK